ncbi:MAG: heavy-metal-associated domain-containing protein [Bacteroidales bacterium]|nr:heavy-metal-associated domain-containing protein [Bacteroidales bacterium]
MKSIKFKTSLKCDGCINAIKPGIDAIKEIESWKVLLDTQDKTLEVNFKDSDENELSSLIQDAVTKAGYNIEKL